MLRRPRAVVLALILAAMAPASGAAQPSVPLDAEPAGESSTLVFFNRPIVTLRARVLGRDPAERADAARRALESLVAEGITGPVGLRRFEGGILIDVGSRSVLAIVAPDVDEVSGERVDDVAAEAADHLRRALADFADARAPGVLLRSAAFAAAGFAATILLLVVIVRTHERVIQRLLAIFERKIERLGDAGKGAVRASRVLDLQRGLTTLVLVGAALIVSFIGLMFVLRQFPFTRPWGESLSGVLLQSVEQLGAGVLNAIPGLFTVALIALCARVGTRLIRYWFDAVEQGRIAASWIYPETAQPTRRLVTALLWVFAIVVAYPYVPGSSTEAFKGVSVFVGLMVTLGSSGVVNQLMSGFMILYSRALRCGDFVRVGDVEGTVVQVGMLSTKIRTVRLEEVTVPNAVVIAHTTTDYSRPAGEGAVYTEIAVTIGYDAPWRQVHAMLLTAAQRTPGILRDPEPVVLQAALEDFYVRYTLFVCLERQDMRLFTLNALHGNIQDEFNEHGVQIMSPNYVLDPATPKIVDKKDWNAAPARATESASPSAFR